MKKVDIKIFFSASIIFVGATLTAGLVWIISNYYVPFQIAFGFSDLQIGNLMTLHGTIGLFMYLPSGYLCDRFKVKDLLALGFFSSGILGIWVSFLPSYNVMLFIYAIYAITGILLIYAAYAKVPRLIVKTEEVAKTTGILVMISKVISALVSAVCVYILSRHISTAVSFQIIMRIYSVIVIIAAIVSYFTFTPKNTENEKAAPKIKVKDYLKVLKYRRIWYICIYGFSAYLAYCALVYDIPYLVYGFDMDIALSSAFGVLETYVLTAIAAPIIGLVASKIKSASKAIMIVIYLSALCFLMLVMIPADPQLIIVFVILFLLATFLSAGAWQLMFVPISEIDVPVEIGGMAIGMVSTFTYIVEAFFYGLAGSWIDKFGLYGYVKIFKLSFICLLIASVACTILVIENRKAKENQYKQIDSS